jgi:hypothetical protein
MLKEGRPLDKQSLKRRWWPVIPEGRAAVSSTALLNQNRNCRILFAGLCEHHASTVAVEHGANQTMKRKDFGQEPTMPGTTTRAMKLSAGVASFDAALVKRFREIAAKAPTGAEHIQSEVFGEEGPVKLRLPQPYQHGDDEVA